MKKRLTIENRILIEELLKLNYKLKDISTLIECEPSTISREIKKRRITGKGQLKNVIKLIDFLLFVMVVYAKHISEWKIITIVIKALWIYSQSF